jgi:hypothetical protein
MPDPNYVQGPQYPLQNAYSRYFGGMTEAIQHYMTYQYMRCQLWRLPDGKVLMVVHA